MRSLTGLAIAFSKRVSYPNRYRPTARSSNGFTLVELMVVVVIITGLSALAIPSIVQQMRDRRARQTAEEVASAFRQARLRALSRGSAVLVRYTKSTRSFTTKEAVLGGSTPSCAQLPVSSCTNTVWTTGSTTAQDIVTWSPPVGISTDVYADPSIGGKGTLGSLGSGLTDLDICFTPMGKTLIRLTDGDVFVTMTSIPAIRVYLDNSNALRRQVIIPPNGLARTDVAGASL